ncbi:hypothetical protein ABZY31_03095 [Streptomyces sp. NPDC006529]|uniref:hypothetical protein n=1 Tax=Streptomyces sp. NPDC006529 TaxID=3157177 RepID=UPI00339E618B
MSGPRAWIGDLVEDEDGQPAVVTDVAGGAVWVLRPPDGLLAPHWITTDPGSLYVVQTRADRLRLHRPAAAASGTRP